MNPKQRKAMFAKKRVRNVQIVRRISKQDALASTDYAQKNPTEYIKNRAFRGAVIGGAIGLPLFPVGSVVGAGIGYHVGKSRAKRALFERVRRI